MRIENHDVREMRPTAKLVYVTIRDADGALAQHEIAERSSLNARGVRDVLDELVAAGLVEAEHNLADLREMHYTIRQEVDENSG
ncbi:hypothetical protein [Halobacterium salinarum]|uniref:hypothetical protein n=1 Tax=Halobacterium salinarum TaxID=2242 RepID=UPI0025558938|nr:hypothetical protein [Halobacterium salinarum]MDL0127091.1 hypothetical protein [Halobacterium salinarum]